MKKTICTILGICSLSFGFGQANQNQTFGPINNGFNSPVTLGQQFGSEIFRFRTGLVTQLDSGSGFTTNNSQWFALGRVGGAGSTFNQTFYGIRFQQPNRGLLMGYTSTSPNNPIIQWIGTGATLGNLEFRTASALGTVGAPAPDLLVATMTKSGSTIFGNPLITGNNAKVSVENSDFTNGLLVENVGVNGVLINNSGQKGLVIESNQSDALGFEINTIGDNPVGGRIKTTGSENNTGLALFTSGGESSTGIFSFADAAALRVIAIRGRTNGQALFEASIYGETPQVNGSQFAAFFDGETFSTTGWGPSDAKLKENVKVEENVLERLSKLTAVTYNFKNITELNLPRSIQHGFIAQELAEVFPELTQDIAKPVFDKDGKIDSNFEFKSVNYTGLISILTSAVNELNGEIKVLKEEIEDLRNGTDSEKNSKTISQKVVLEQNIPNPFSDRTTIKYQLPQGTSRASLIIFDMNGGIKKEFPLTENKSEISVTASQIGKGLFIYSLVQNGQILETKKMIIQ